MSEILKTIIGTVIIMIGMVLIKYLSINPVIDIAIGGLVIYLGIFIIYVIRFEIIKD